MAEADNLPRVLVLGGTGFIGRHFVAHLVNNGLVKLVRVVDKVPPQMAWLNDSHKEVFKSPVVEFKHASLINAASVNKAFSHPDGEFDYVINLAAETKYGQSDSVYQEGIVKLSLNCAKEAANRNVKLFIEFSAGQMSSSEKKAAKESCDCEPWTRLAKHKLQVENHLKSIPGLNYIIIRPAIVYGCGDKYGLTPRIIVGSIYKYIKQKMKMLWNKEMKMNTIHVGDVSRAVWHLCQHGTPGEIYNAVDSANSTQGDISQLVSHVFNIQYDFLGNMTSNLLKVRMSSVVEDINEKHMEPWADACQKDGITSTPLTPFLDEELLYHKHTHLDGSKLYATGLTFMHEKVQEECLKQVVDDYIRLGLFPKSLLLDDSNWADAADMANEEEYLEDLREDGDVAAAEDGNDDDDDDNDDNDDNKII